MAAKNPMTEPSVKNAAIVETAPQVSADDAAKTPAQKAAEAPGAIADPAPATTFDDPSGAIVEPAITGGVNLGHEAIDANPRAWDWLDFVLSPTGQAEFAKKGFRPIVEGAEYGDVDGANDPANPFPVPSKLFTIADLGGWTAANTKFFEEGTGIVPQIQKATGKSQ